MQRQNIGHNLDYDICIIGGGINGCGIARDAAGRGLRVLLLEAEDLGSATSSASTKLIHGGLRYLEHYEFGLVREALNERETLLKSSPHIIWPLEFILPHEPHLRPAWMIRIGLFLYDRLGKRTLLRASRKVKIKSSDSDNPLKSSYKTGFAYSDCWVDDARLVVLNAMDAAEKGADILTRTPCTSVSPRAEDGWIVRYKSPYKKDIESVTCRYIVNATGPWVREFLDKNNLSDKDTPGIRLSKGSHIIVPKLYNGKHAYILQQPDKRIVFTIPYEHDYTLIGTTDVEYNGDPRTPHLSDEESDYLCEAVNRSFKKQISLEDVIHHYSGVRPLLDDGEDNPSEITRDYKLDLSRHGQHSLMLNVYGGKITTHRALSEETVDTLKKHDNLIGQKWTSKAFLPGGNIDNYNFEAFFKRVKDTYGFLDHTLLYRLARSYGTKINLILADILTAEEMGENYGAHLTDAEVIYLIKYEWARTAEDILWRRTKCGLHMSAQEIRTFVDAFPQILKKAMA